MRIQRPLLLGVSSFDTWFNPAYMRVETVFQALVQRLKNLLGQKHLVVSAA